MNPVNPMSGAPAQALLRYRGADGRDRQAGVPAHPARHSFAKHLMEQNTDIRLIQVLLGHAKLDTTALYTRVAPKIIREIVSPFDRITGKLKEDTEPPA